MLNKVCSTPHTFSLSVRVMTTCRLNRPSTALQRYRRAAAAGTLPVFSSVCSSQLVQETQEEEGRLRARIREVLSRGKPEERSAAALLLHQDSCLIAVVESGQELLKEEDPDPGPLR